MQFVFQATLATEAQSKIWKSTIFQIHHFRIYNTSKTVKKAAFQNQGNCVLIPILADIF